MRELHLFAGAGGGILGGLLCGHVPVCAVEMEAYPRRVLLQRQRDGVLPWFPIWDDVRTFDGKPWQGRVDLVAGGFPCQAWSSAARGNHTAANLWPEMLRVIGEVCPRFVFAENVDEGAILMAQHDLASAGFKTLRAMVAASDLGADHPRERWWLLAYSHDEGELGSGINAEVAFQPKSSPCLWKTPPRVSGVAHGLAHRMDRFRAIGNGQVPAVAHLAFRTLYNRLMEVPND